MSLAITICATKNYCYALEPQARRVQSCVAGIDKGTIILAGDSKEEFEKISRTYKGLLPNWEVHKIFFSKPVGALQNYKEQAQLTIAQGRSALFAAARALNVDFCWSLDSDVLPPVNALKCMLTTLEFDDKLYSVATCSYPSQGGGGMLGGRGTIYQPILPDFYEDERDIPAEVAQQAKACREKLEVLAKERPGSREEAEKVWKQREPLLKQLEELDKKIKECPPLGNVFAMNAKGWKRRGWLDNAYPAIGWGAVLPTDWCGFGCTLMNRKALALADFSGYEGKGTEDLYICWRRWYPAGLKLNVIPHCLCDHVIRNPGYIEGKTAKYVLCQAYHETEGECVGHIRVRHLPFYTFEFDEKYDEKNNGQLLPAPEEKVKVRADER